MISIKSQAATAYAIATLMTLRRLSSLINDMAHLIVLRPNHFNAVPIAWSESADISSFGLDFPLSLLDQVQPFHELDFK